MTIFLLTLFFYIVILFIPAYPLLRLIGLNKSVSFAIGPTISMGIYPFLGIAYSILHIPSSYASISVPLIFLFSITSYMLIRKNNPKKADLHFWKEIKPAKLLMPITYVIVASIIGSYLFLSLLDNPETVIQSFDNIFHYNLIRHYDQSNDWSILHASVYPIGSTSSEYPSNGLVTGSYYPAGWHILCAIAMQTSGCSLQVAVNASVFVFSAIVFPIGVWSLLLAIFGRKASILLSGAIMASAFACFPWGLLISYPLFPNLVSTALVPASAAAIITIFQKCHITKQRIICILTLSLLFLMAFCFTQPNGFFTLAVLISPFLISTAYKTGKHNTLRSFSYGFIICALIGVGWIAAFLLPPMQDVVQYNWDPIASPTEEIFNILNLNYILIAPQYLVSFITCLGIIVLLWQKEHRWVICSYLLSLIILFVCTTQGDTFIKHFLSGFWYTDSHRVAAIASICAIPIAAKGLDAICSFFSKLTEDVNISRTIDAAIAALISTVIFFGTPLDTNNAFKALREKGAERISQSAYFYGSDKQHFVEEVKTIVSKDEIILNNPYDGSALSFAFNDLNIYYRDLYYRSESALELVKSYPLVMQASNTNYYLTLGAIIPFAQYQSSYWSSLEAVNGNTPGFELVLEKNEMKLYRIDRNEM